MSDPNVRLTLKGGGWVLVLMALVIIGIVGWAVAPAVLRLAYPAPVMARVLNPTGLICRIYNSKKTRSFPRCNTVTCPPF